MKITPTTTPFTRVQLVIPVNETDYYFYIGDPVTITTAETTVTGHIVVISSTTVTVWTPPSGGDFATAVTNTIPIKQITTIERGRT